MANLPKHSNGTKKHNCGYGQLTNHMAPDDGHHSTSKTKGLPTRPKTRRHPEDLPHCTREKHPKSSGDKSDRSCSKYPLACIGYLHRKSKSKTKDLNLKDIILTASTLEDVSCPSDRTSHLNSVRIVRKDKGPSSSRSLHPCPLAHSEAGNVKSTCTTPENYSLRNVENPSLEDHEYLQFLLRITEDIIKNDLYSNKEMKKVFTNHVKANKDRLQMDRMLLRIHELMKELNIPLSVDTEEDSSASWTDIETTMKNLLSIEKTKLQEDSNKQDGESKTEHPPKGKCICFDLRSTYHLMNPKNNPKGEDIEDIENEKHTPTSTFRTSLDRLTEHTEPPSSRATCKISTSFSNFEDVDVLPGFECLETPKVSAGVLCELYSRPKSAKDISTTICHCHLVKKKTKIRKRKLKKRKKVKSIKKIDEDKQNNKSKSHNNYYTQHETNNLRNKSSAKKYNEKPIIIPLHEPTKIQSTRDDTNLRIPNNDYVLIKGPVYLLKTFLERNPQMLIGNELPPNPNDSTKISLRDNDKNLIDEESNNPKTVDIYIGNNKKTEENNQETKELKKNVKENLEKDANDLKIHEYENKEEDVMRKDEENLRRIKNDNKIGSADGRKKDDKFEEIRNILLELTNFPIGSTSSLEDEHEQAFHYFDYNDGCGHTENSVGSENSKLCKLTCPNKYICEKLKMISTDVYNPRNNNERKSMDDEYDYTPQKEEIAKNRYQTPSNIIQDFLKSREIQTEDIPHIPTIVGAVHVSHDKLTDKDSPGNSEVESNQAESNENFNQTMEKNDQKNEPIGNYFAHEEIPEPKRYNLLMSAKPVNKTEELLPKIIQEASRNASEAGMPVASSVVTNATFGTLTSTATVSPTRPHRENEDQLPRNVSPLFQMYGPIDASKEESKEDMQYRKVSILKNPIVQAPSVDKVFSDNEESKRKGESIIRAVEGLKDRQATRDPILDKVIHEIESNRGTRIPERVTSTEVSVRSDLALPGPSALKNPGKGSYYPSEDTDTSESSNDVLPVNVMNSVGQQGDDIKTAEQSANTENSLEVTSDPNFYANLDEQPELRGTPSQIRQINKINEKLDQLRYVNDKDETEISKTLDKLVETLKEQQDKEDKVQVKSEETENTKDNSKRKKPFTCCGFLKKKKTQAPSPINEPEQSTFSEADYKAKSEAFELALASLGQRSKSLEQEDLEKMKSKPAKEESLRKMDDYFGPSPIRHSGNRLSLVRIADEKETDMKELNESFEDVSRKISNDRVK